MTAESARAPRRLHGSAFWLLGRAARLAQETTLARLAEVGLKRYFYGVLATLDEFGPSAQADIGRRLGVDPSDMVAVLNDLEQLGYVRRRRDPDDRRRNRVEATPAGLRTLAGYDRAVGAAEEDFLAGLSGAERRRLVVALQRMVLTPADDPPVP